MVSHILILVCLFLTSVAFAEPPNLSLFKKELQIYHDSGLYEQELTRVLNKARLHIFQQLKLYKHKANKLAIILDVDETSITNYQQMHQRNFAEHHDLIHKAILAANAPPIHATLSLYNEAILHGIKIFFISGRPQSTLYATKVNLWRAGFKNWAGLYLRPEHYKKNSIIAFKAKTRAAITKLGYRIIASIGDQESDLKGGYVDLGFKLPNPFYHIP